jgi:hypothetical protein
MKVSWKDMRVLVCLVVLALLPAVVAAQDRPLCHDWNECRQFALKAYADGDAEAFYDFARRTVAAGPPRDARLMLLLARAQSVSGRTDDAIQMLGRLAQMRARTDADTSPDFAAVRATDSWPALKAALEGRRSAAPERSTSAAGAASVDKPVGPVGPGRPAEPVGPARPAEPPVASAPTPLEVALRIPATLISPTGLAYDHVSGRFLMADSTSDKLVSVDELSRHMVDLVKADSAGFRDITAFEIDTRRGDLWVVSAGKPGGTDHESVTALHKLQLISGRPLAKFQPGDGFGDTRFQDVAIAKSGDVFVLDAAGGRVFRLAPRTTALKVACRLRLDHPVSLAIAGDRAAIAYVAHAGGLARVDLATGHSTRVAASKSLRLDGLERIRFDSGHVVATQRGEDGVRHVVSIRIAGGASPRASAIERLDGVDAVASGTLTALSGDDVYFLTREAGHDGEDGEFVVQRARVR